MSYNSLGAAVILRTRPSARVDCSAINRTDFVSSKVLRKKNGKSRKTYRFLYLVAGARFELTTFGL